MITSTQNPKIQAVRALLARPRERRLQGGFVVEGVRLVEEGAAAAWPASLVLYSETLSPRGMAVVERLAGAGAEAEPVADRVLQSVSDTETSQGILAVFRLHPLPWPEALDFVLIADGIRDPGNLGTLMRTASAAGAHGIVLTPDSVDAFAPKVLRAAMGAHFHLPVQTLEWPAIALFVKERPRPLRVFLAESGQGLACWQADLRQPIALVIGGEAEGASTPARRLADASLTIPMPGPSESLNAAAAAAILMFEVVRQRSIPIP